MPTRPVAGQSAVETPSTPGSCALDGPKGLHRSAPLGRHDRHHPLYRQKPCKGPSCRLCRTSSYPQGASWPRIAPRPRRSPHDRPQHRDDLVDPDGRGLRRTVCPGSHGAAQRPRDRSHLAASPRAWPAPIRGPRCRESHRDEPDSVARLQSLPLAGAGAAPAARSRPRSARAAARARRPMLTSRRCTSSMGPPVSCSPAGTPVGARRCSTS